jgi:hypothetical protein
MKEKVRFNLTEHLPYFREAYLPTGSFIIEKKSVMISGKRK